VKDDLSKSSQNVGSILVKFGLFAREAMTNGRLFHFIFEVFRFSITVISAIAPSTKLFAAFAVLVIPIHAVSAMNSLQNLGIHPTAFFSFLSLIGKEIQGAINWVKELFGMETDENGGERRVGDEGGEMEDGGGEYDDDGSMGGGYGDDDGSMGSGYGDDDGSMGGGYGDDDGSMGSGKEGEMDHPHHDHDHDHDGPNQPEEKSEGGRPPHHSHLPPRGGEMKGEGDHLGFTRGHQARI